MLGGVVTCELSGRDETQQDDQSEMKSLHDSQIQKESVDGLSRTLEHQLDPERVDGCQKKKPKMDWCRADGLSQQLGQQMEQPLGSVQVAGTGMTSRTQVGSMTN